MKMYGRRSRIFVSLLFGIVSSLMMPLKALAEKKYYDDSLQMYVDANDFSRPSEMKKSPLKGEYGRSSEYIKEFKREDGLSEIVSYPYPVHFFDGEKWKDIDNTLTYEETDRMYHTKEGKYEISLGESLGSDTLLRYSIREDEYVRWSLKDREDIKGKETEYERPADPDMELRFPSTLFSGVEYEGEDEIIRYDITSYMVSEKKILKERPASDISYVYEIRTMGLEAQMQEDGSLLFIDEEGEGKLLVTKPYMTDSRGEDSDEIAVLSEYMGEEDGERIYSLSVTPSMEWLCAEEREYPVVIDPDIRSTFRDNVEDTYISNSQQTTNFGSRDRVKIGASSHYRALIKITDLPELKSGDVILESTLNVSKYNDNASPGTEVDLHKVNASWSEGTVTWNSFNAVSDAADLSRVESLVCVEAYNNFNIFDITDLTKQWYAGTTANNGVLLKIPVESTNTYIEYRSANYNAAYAGHPYFSIIYFNSTGLEDNFSYHSATAGRAGTGSVNDCSGNLTWIHSDATITNGVLGVSLSHAYNTNDRDTDIGYGYGWRLNYAQSIRKVTLENRTGTSTYYEHTDGDGTRHYYVQSGSTYVNELDKQSTLTISGTTVTIKDKRDSKLIFTCDSSLNNGKLTKVEDAYGNSTLITYSSSGATDLKITKIQEALKGQSAGQALTLTYSGGHLSGISSPDGLNITCTYGSNDLTGITYADSRQTVFTYSSHRLTQAKNKDNYSINYTYTATLPCRVTKAEERSGSTLGGVHQLHI